MAITIIFRWKQQTRGGVYERFYDRDENAYKLWEEDMKTYVLMTKLSPEVSRQMKDRAAIGRAWLDQVREKCPEVNFIIHLALLGPYDFLDIYEAPDEETAAKVSMISSSNGALVAESWSAIPYKRFLELTKEI
jgi:uncharacterized protein with GYD domain